MRIVDIATNIQYEKVDDKQIERMLIKQAVCLDVMFIATADSAMEDGNPEKITAAAKLQEASRKPCWLCTKSVIPKSQQLLSSS